MKSNRPDILLKIFSGPHIGAELALTSGTYTIGNGDDCDIILQDASIGHRHAILTVTEKNIEISPLDNKSLLIGGKFCEQSRHSDLSMYSVITIGTTHLAVGQEGGDWSKVRIPKMSTNMF